MLYSKLFGKTNKSAKEYDSINATLLIKAGFIDQTMAGVYSYLPLGLRVLSKITNIVREEMDKIGDEILMPAMGPLENWEATGRRQSVDILFQITPANEQSKIKNDSTYILNPTHEDIVTPIAKKFNFSYKDLPFAVYQIQSKFRNEARPKSGLLRGREFIMKDLYSFHKSEEEFKEFYLKAKEAYLKVYEKLGLNESVYYVAASGGDFTDDFSHEFQIRCETGEDTIFYDEQDKVVFNKEVAPCLAPEPTQEKEEKTMEEILTENVTGVEALTKFLNVAPERTTKTILYETDTGVIAAVVRGDYDVNEVKLKKTAKARWVKLASPEKVKEATGAELGYAGILNLSEKVKVYVDEAVKYLINFEMGANKTNYHYVNVNWYRDLQKPEVFYDIKIAKEGDIYPDTGNTYITFKASEAGNIFPLKTKYTDAFDYTYTDQDGTKKPVYMGSYGIGISRLMGILVEKFHDDKGIIWPEQVAPFKVLLVGLNLEDAEVKKKAYNLYQKMVDLNKDVLFDDRENISAGEKLSDADLMGIPVRVVVSKKSGDKFEVKRREDKEGKLITEDDLFTNHTL